MKLFLLTIIVSICASASSPATADEPEALFNGRDLSGWRGAANLWSVEDGAITGRTSDAAPLKSNSFLIHEKPVADFHLTFEYRIENGNSGVQYRSKVADEAEFIVAGYQADIDATGRYNGIHYEERGRGILAERGQVTVIGDAPPSDVLGTCGEPAALGEIVKAGEWNKYKIVAVGNHTMHFINGVLMSAVTDRGANVAKEGVLALQIHVGPAMKVQFRNIELKRLPPAAGQP